MTAALHRARNHLTPAGIGRAVALGLVSAFILAGILGLFAVADMPMGAQVGLVILLVAATLWISEAVPLFVTSFAVLMLCLVWLGPELRASGVDVSDTEFLAAFFSDVILLFLGGFVLSAALHKYRIDERLARSVIARTGRSIPLLLIGVMSITAFLSMWLSNTATAAMMLALCLPIVARLPVEDAYRKALLLAVPFAANVGGLGTPIGSPPNAIAMQYMRQAGVAPSFATWMLIGVPGVLGMLAVTWGVLMLVYRGSHEEVELDADAPALERSPALVAVIVISLLTVLGWVTAGWHGFSAGTVALIPVLAFFGIRILDVKDLRGLSWDVLLMMGGGLCLGRAIAVSGLAAWLVEQLPVEGLSGYVLVVVFASAACLMSSVMSNTATANLLMPIVLGLGAEQMPPILIGVAFACTLAMPLPISTPPNAIAFSSGELTVKQMLLPGLIITFIGIVLSLTTGYWWWDLMGLY